MKVKTLAAVISILFCLLGSSSAQRAVFAPATSIVQGNVSDSAGGIEGIPIEINGTGGKFEVLTNSEGLYKAKVPPGTYSVSVKPSQWDPAYRPFQRAKFRILPGEVKIIDLSAYSGFDYCSSGGERVVNIRASGVTRVGYSTAKSPRYARFPITTPAGEMELMIEYCGKKQQKDSIKFRSVVISFDESTIYADSATFYPGTLRLKVGGKEIQLVVRKEHSVVSDLSLSFGGGNVYFDIPKGFTSSVKGKGLIEQGERSFEIAVDRALPSYFVYQDKQKGFIFRSNPNDFFFVKTVSPNVLTLSGSGTLSGPGVRGSDGYYDFSVTLETSTDASSALTMEIPQLDYRHIGNIPSNAVIITREKELYEVTDPRFTKSSVKTTAMTWP